MKYKVGDKVRIRPDLQSFKMYGDCYANTLMIKYAGETTTIKSVNSVHSDKNYYGVHSDKNYYLDIDSGSWHWTSQMLEPACDKEEIHITCNNGVVTHAVYKKNGKVINKSSAKLHPDDAFDFPTGAAVTFARLFDGVKLNILNDDEKEVEEKKNYYNGYVVCVHRAMYTPFVEGKIYKVTDGIIYDFKTSDEVSGYRVSSLKELVERYSCDFVELDVDYFA